MFRIRFCALERTVDSTGRVVWQPLTWEPAPRGVAVGAVARHLHRLRHLLGLRLPARG